MTFSEVYETTLEGAASSIASHLKEIASRYEGLDCEKQVTEICAHALQAAVLTYQRVKVVNHDLH